MATQHFDNLGTVPEPLLPFSLLMNGYATPLRLIRPQQAWAVDRDEDWPSSAATEEGNMGRCIRWAFAIEGGAAAAIYAIWTLCRLLW